MTPTPGRATSTGPSSPLTREYAVVAIDASGLVTDWDQGAERLLRLGGEEALGRPLDECLSGPGVLQALLATAAAAGSAQAADAVRLRDAGGVSLDLTVSALRSTNAEPSGFVVVLRESSSVRPVEQAIDRSSAVFENILSIATDGVVCVDGEQRITFFNQGAERIFGYRAQDVLGQPLDLLIPDALRHRHGAHLKDFSGSPVTARQMGERGEISGRRSDGTVFPAEASISKLRVGESVVFTAVLRDVTERKQAEEALARQAAELARSNAELEQFAYVASHDLQEPLRMVASYTQLLARRYGDRLDDDAREFIGYAVDGVTRMQALINDLLAYSRVGRREITPGTVDLQKLLERVLITLGPAIEEAEAQVTYDPLPELPGDAVQLSQLFQNLIGNALKFRTEVPPRVRVDVQEEGDEWLFCVRDNGIGIPPEFAQRIFDIFQRLHTRDQYPGTGIGLAICKRIVERHGGRIWVESADGAGSTFHFTLPREL
jgi:PAS domain S-box-containing protein